LVTGVQKTCTPAKGEAELPGIEPKGLKTESIYPTSMERSTSVVFTIIMKRTVYGNPTRPVCTCG
jgi:hypothetical protein